MSLEKTSRRVLRLGGGEYAFPTLQNDTEELSDARELLGILGLNEFSNVGSARRVQQKLEAKGKNLSAEQNEALEWLNEQIADLL